MFDKVKLRSKGSNPVAAVPAATPGQPPSTRQIYQSRKNFGVNIGACFVSEKWIFHELFGENVPEFELAAVEAMVRAKGLDGAKSTFENFWSNFMNDNDWRWLQDNQVTSVRIPIGYWDVAGGRFTKGTQFEKYGSSVYSGAWNIFKEKFVKPAGKHNISVLVDLHGLPGGANSSDHSGEKSGGSAAFWSNEKFQLQVAEMLTFIARDLQQFENISGIQVVNEAEFAQEPASKQTTYYVAALNSIREADSGIPVIISDGWWTDQWVRFIQKHQQNNNSLGLIIDHHVYRCFSKEDKDKSPMRIIEDLNNDVLTNLTDNGKGVDIMVGEFSCVLDQQSWNKDGAQGRRDELVIQYGNRQCDLINERAGMGFYFWTYKFQSGNGGEWDLKQMVEKGAIRNPFSVNGKRLPDRSMFEQAYNQAMQGHVGYWSGTDPGGRYEHERYGEGFTTAWADAEEFAKFNGSVLGRVEAWRIARLSEHIRARGASGYLWEWEQGFYEGLKQFHSNVR
ncbi:glucan 1,3-beta-glucosidase [Scheffersomyces stipitis CBS 6054]|uniref:Glucan 1,3-beta-glucosidase n=1 Tax=Scheffersomyces stipitis (strain ATCC 58785 / CBS 6054 / NBRC 10063 / NRRL Y-11545) TaxID=322104 RepID=A3LWQ4_PICST|nr:glucan 1,3-beta-glucosidase [Scheffersomyces stipitis CBS 6054]ABN67676.2 glucan 1,3-beta-glucosidase [Scheffersomyces stipitis CBS 6054]KAG2732414.1 hypothetical protein G9P44_004831 [Scheffersomyces stipitis]